MTFLIAAAVLVASGLAILHLSRLTTHHLPTDLALGWFVGSGAYACIGAFLRFAIGIPAGRVPVLLVLISPVVVLGWNRMRQRQRVADDGNAQPVAEATTPWIPRPAWVWVPLILYVVLVAGATLLHGFNTPTQTDDGLRVRSFASILAYEDSWSPQARDVFVLAGAVPTFVPALGWSIAGGIDPFHVNFAVLADLVGLLTLVIGLGVARGNAQQGWAGAFGLLSIPLLVYHFTSTYSDAVLATRVGVGFLFAVEYSRTRDRRDAILAMLLFGLATLVKREGAVVAGAGACGLVVQMLAERVRGGRDFPSGALVAGLVPVAVGMAGTVAAVGAGHAFPILELVLARAGVGGAPLPSVAATGLRGEAALEFFDLALFRSGNAGMIYWLLAATMFLRGRATLRSGLIWPLLSVAALLLLVAVNSILILPQFTLDQTTVHRALLVATVPAALWLAAALTDAAAEGG